MKLISEAKGIVRCLYNEERQTTQNDWTTFLSMPDEREHMRQSLQVFLDFVKENKVFKHIVNVKNCTEPMCQEDLEWVTTYFVPKEIENGIRYLANIVSNDIFTQLTTQEWQEKVENGLVVKNFSSMEEAHLWLADKKFKKIIL